MSYGISLPFTHSLTLRHGLMEPGLSSSSLLAQDDLELLTLLPFESQLLELLGQVFCGAGDPVQGSIHPRQALCQPGYIPYPHSQFS